MTVTAKFANIEHTSVVIHLESGDNFGGEYVQEAVLIPANPEAGIEELDIPAGQPKDIAVGMDPSNVLFKAVFPEAKTERDPSTGNLRLVQPYDLGIPAIPVEDYVEPEASVPTSIPMYRAKIVLQTTPMPSDETTTVWDKANTFIDNIPDARMKLIAKTAFNDAPDLFRNSPTLAVVINYLKSQDDKVTDKFIDDMFFEAVALEI